MAEATVPTPEQIAVCGWFADHSTHFYTCNETDDQASYDRKAVGCMTSPDVFERLYYVPRGHRGWFLLAYRLAPKGHRYVDDIYECIASRHDMADKTSGLWIVGPEKPRWPQDPEEEALNASVIETWKEMNETAFLTRYPRAQNWLAAV